MTLGRGIRPALSLFWTPRFRLRGETLTPAAGRRLPPPPPPGRGSLHFLAL